MEYEAHNKVGRGLPITSSNKGGGVKASKKVLMRAGFVMEYPCQRRATEMKALFFEFCKHWEVPNKNRTCTIDIFTGKGSKENV